jgi:hypothetical protein
MKTRSNPIAALAIITAGSLLAGCGGGGGSNADTTPTAGTTPPTAAAPTAGAWKGTIVSTTTGQSSQVVALTGHDGHSVWMTTDGRVWSGQVPLSGSHFDATFSGHMHEGAQFPDGTSHGSASMAFDHHAMSSTAGHYTGSGDTGTFHMGLSPMWSRPASMETVAGVYTRSTSNGYSMTMTIGANGQLLGSDSQGCVINGSVGVPDATHNMYAIDATVTSCGSLDGRYLGMGTLLDADAMQDWMTSMHPLEHGGHSHGGSMMGGGHMGHNTVPSGHHNLFMFSMVSDHSAIMDAVAR